MENKEATFQLATKYLMLTLSLYTTQAPKGERQRNTLNSTFDHCQNEGMFAVTYIYIVHSNTLRNT